MSSEHEEQLRHLLGERECNDIPESLSWKAMEPRLFPSRRSVPLIWLFPILLLVTSGFFIWLTSYTETEKVSASAIAIKSPGPTETAESVNLKVPAQRQEAQATMVDGGPRPPVSPPIMPSSGQALRVEEIPILPAAQPSPVAVQHIPTLAIELLAAGSIPLPDLQVLPLKRIIPAAGPPRRTFSLATGPGTFSLPLRPIRTLPQDRRIESTFANARSLQLRVTILRRGPVNLITGFAFRKATNTLVSSALAGGQVVTANLTSLHLPLLVGYQYGTGRWTLQAAAGPSVEVSRWARGETLLRNGLAGPAATLYADTPAFPLALTSEIGVEFRLWPRLGLLMGMSYTAGGTRLRYLHFEQVSRQVYRGGVVGVVFYPRG